MRCRWCHAWLLHRGNHWVHASTGKVHSLTVGAHVAEPKEGT